MMRSSSPLPEPDDLAPIRACRAVACVMLPGLVERLPHDFAGSGMLAVALGAPRLRVALLAYWRGMLEGAEPGRHPARAAAVLARELAAHGVTPEAALAVHARLLAGLLDGLGLGERALPPAVPVAAETRRQARLRAALTRLGGHHADWLRAAFGCRCGVADEVARAAA